MVLLGWLWKSCLWGRGLLEKAIHWRIGNGCVPRPFSFKPISPAHTACPRGIWNENVIEQLFLPIDKELIYLIPLGIVNITVLSSLLTFDFMCFLVLVECPCIILSQTQH
ncbi:hypothetical protein PanWU01x14_106930 [Parasponia andersonii]|uniref:Uncharacterized protein n=1 Tax=Parasponia andersonii TaxID=3476 RepID=A0A2P5D0X2_PARAD|nr:hypothetical protein PanWU01x14_106930 [Parasponia andersonii]